MSKRTDEARALARKAHAGQTDKLGVDYMEHVEAVAAAVAHLGEEFEITALLHDTVEDCEDTDLVNLPLIVRDFGQQIAHAVDCITKRPGIEYSEYLEGVSGDHIACAVKRADIAHNRSRLKLLPDPIVRSRLEKKYARALEVIEQQIAG